MTNELLIMAAEETLPLETAINPLLPMPYDIVWSVIPILVILFVFWKLVLPMFQKVLTEREERIEGGIQRAEAAQAEAKAALDKYNAQLAEARTEAAKIREEARVQGQQIIDEMKAQATEESNRIIESGHQQLAANRAQVVADLRSEMGQQSIDLAERLLSEQLSDDVKRQGTVDRFIAELDVAKGR